MKMLFKKLFHKKPNVSNHKSNTATHPMEMSKWQLALEYSSIGVWEYDAELDEVFFSEGSKQIIGINDPNFGNNPNDWNNRVHPEDQATYFKDFQDHLNNHKTMYENEHRIQCEDGKYKWIRDRGKIVEWTPSGKYKRIIGTHTDITSRKEEEQKLEKYLQLITSQNKRLHNFTHIVSHNLKTHIGNFKNILEFYEEARTDTEKEELIGHLKTISGALTDTIVDLNDIINIKSKSEDHVLNENVNIRDCADKIIESLKRDSELLEVTLYNTIAPNVVLASNRAYLESIFYNLVSNAIKYKAPDRPATVVLKSEQDAASLRIIISDNGIGIDLDKYRHQLFEMYQTFHGTDREDSRGVGLYITKTQVEALGGTIDIDSRLGTGTTFTLTFEKTKAS